jgi:hypothetical protein
MSPKIAKISGIIGRTPTPFKRVDVVPYVQGPYLPLPGAVAADAHHNIDPREVDGFHNLDE